MVDKITCVMEVVPLSKRARERVIDGRSAAERVNPVRRRVGGGGRS